MSLLLKKAVDADALKVGSGGTGQQQPSKPVANRSVRVDIEKLDVLMNLVASLL